MSCLNQFHQHDEGAHRYVRVVRSPQDKPRGKGCCGSLFRHRPVACSHKIAMTDTAQLQVKIAELVQRIHQLEEGLEILQSTISAEPHPLLKDELLSVKYGSGNTEQPQSEQSSEAQTVTVLEPLIDSLGSWSIGDQGQGKYFGRSAGAEVSLGTTSISLFNA